MIRKSDASNPTIGSRETDDSESECRWDAAGWMRCDGLQDSMVTWMIGKKIPCLETMFDPVTAPLALALCPVPYAASRGLQDALLLLLLHFNHPSMYTGSN